MNFTFNKSHVGLSYRLGCDYSFKNHFSTGLGVKYIQWVPITDNQNHVFKNRFKPDNFKEHLGFYYNFNYYPLKPGKLCIHPFLFYDFSFTKSTLVLDGYFYLTQAIDTTTGRIIEIYEHVTDKFQPVIATEHHLGIGIDIRLYKGLMLTQKSGGGIAQFFDVEWRRGVRSGIWEFAWMFNIGLKYNFEDVIANSKRKKSLKKQ